MRRNQRLGMRPLLVGVLVLGIAIVGVFFAFTKRVPFRHHYTIHAVVTNSNLVTPGSPVRIAGVAVGKVAKVGRYRDTDLSELTLQMDKSGLPVHKDATLKIRPRLFLEGNFYVDLQPGTPSTTDLGDGGLIPASQTATPVQLDQVLTALQSDTRGNLQQAIQGLGAGFGATPSASDDAQQDPSVRGKTGGQALNLALKTGPQALTGTAKVATGLLGTEPHDLSRTIDGLGRATAGLSEHEDDLTDLVTRFNTTMDTFAAHSADVSAAVDQLGPTAVAADQAFAHLKTAAAPTTTFARNLATSLPELPATIAASKPWLVQAKHLLSQKELGGLLDDLQPGTKDLARLGASTKTFLPKITDFNKCITQVIIPTGNIKVDDGEFSANTENYKEFWYAMVGQNGEGQSFDGNGALLRLSAAGGGFPITSGRTNYAGTPKHAEQYYANATLPPLRTRPAYGNQLPPLNRSTPCYLQPVPDVNGPDSTGPADGSEPGAPAPPAPKAVDAQ
jgi:phospholipid/cholesterol/gamma-HCH transport system substrate-binding protein